MKQTTFITVAVLAIGFLLYLNFAPKKEPGFTKRVIYTDKAPKPIGPYSQGIMTGNTLFVSGQIALNTAGALDTSSIESETKQVLANINAILDAAGMGLGDVVKTTIYLTDLSHFKAVNEYYGKWFVHHPPARETVQVAALPKGARIEISVIAVK
ncbi:MAG: RidA family protein [Bacteroidota bacterium]